MSVRNLRLRSCVCGVLAAAAAGGAALAQEKTTGLEEIVVTAERRAESLQDVPLSISAFSDVTRDRIGIISIQDMANFAPGVSFNMATDRPSIRGIARQSNAFSLDSPVANYFDGVYTSSVQDAQRRPIFIDRTEILRGPQGALSGRGSIAGAFNTISKRPSAEFGWEARAFAANYSQSGIEATITGPITDWFRVRVNLAERVQKQGYFDNIANGSSEGDQPNNRKTQDYMFDFNLGDSITLFLKAAFANYDESRRTGVSGAPYVAGVLGTPTAYGPNSAALVPVASYGYFSAGAVRVGTNTQNPVLVNGDQHQFGNDFRSNQRLDDHHNYTADLVWHAPTVDIRWIGGHQNYKYTQLTDVDTTDVQLMRLSLSPTSNTGRLVSPGGTNMYAEERKWYSNELTATSTGTGSFSWIGGLYHSNEDYNQEPATTIYPGYPELNRPWGTVAQVLPFVSAALPPFPAAPATAPTPPPPNPVPFRAQYGYMVGTTVSKAVFGQVDYKLNDAWKFTVGLRYNKDEKELVEQNRFIANGLGNGLGPFLAGGGLTAFPAVGGPISLDVTSTPATVLQPGVVWDRIDPATGYRMRRLENDWSALTGSAGVDFKMTPDDLMYFRYAKGYRPGGFNAPFLTDPPMVDKESVNSFEVGYKTTLFSRLQLSTSAFYYDYRDIQMPLPTLGRCTDPAILSTCTVLNSFVNLPKGESKGLELEANWAVTDDLSLFLSYGFLDATIKESSTNGFSNTDDPAAVLPNAKRLRQITNAAGVPQTDDVTGLPRWTQDLSGNKLANSPEHRIAFNANYTFRFSPGNLVLSSSYVWRDEQFSDVFETEESKVPSFNTIGLRTLWTNADNDYTVMLYVNNLTDEDAADSATVTRVRTGTPTAATASPSFAAYYRNLNLLPPREFGVEVQFRFGSSKNR